jgi:PBP1b-binding outer membrane lipoprotein LpoB
MLKNQYFIGTAMTLLLLSGCTNDTQPAVNTNKNITYQPIKIDPAPPVVKSESMINIDKADMDRYERDQSQLRDFDKYMQERDRRLRNK